jgi:hypothetical protein
MLMMAGGERLTAHQHGANTPAGLASMVKTVGVRNGPDRPAPAGCIVLVAGSILYSARGIWGLGELSAQSGEGRKRGLCEDAGVDRVRATINEYQ